MIDVPTVGIEGRNQVLTTIFSVMRDRIGVTEIGLWSPQSDGCDTDTMVLSCTVSGIWRLIG